MYKVKTLNNIDQAGLDVLLEAGFEVSSQVENPDAILVRSASMHDMAFGSELLCIARAGAGVNNIPVNHCTEAGIAVFNTPGANAEAVKELAICSILIASRDIIGGVDWVRCQAREDCDLCALVEKKKSNFSGPEVKGKTLGVVGLGAVGAKIANVAVSLGMRVYGYDPYLSVDAAWQLSGKVRHALDLETIYRECDYITLHVPYLPATHHMVDAASIARMKDGVRIVNLARGELVSEVDIIEALRSGKVAKYVTDFPSPAIAAEPNVIPMPHLGASTPESEEKCAVMAAQALEDYLKNGNITNSVNLPSVSLERMGVSRICVIHRNVPRMINRILDIIGAKNINVEHMINKPRGEYAYTIIDTGSPVGEDLAQDMAQMMARMDEILRLRIL